MGRLIAEEVLKDKGLELVCAIEQKGHKWLGKKVGDIIGLMGQGPVTTDNSEAISLCRVFIEFTTPEATEAHLVICADKGVGMVIGTTGLEKKIEDEIKKAGSKIPIVYSPNMSTGINLLFHLTEEAAKVLGNNFDAEIVETHHCHKKDAPSGTAKKLSQIIGAARGNPLPAHAVHSLRIGEVVGEHTVVFAGPGERLELIHRAESRMAFSRGAITAARFVASAPPGLYTMREVLCL
jgi:4-hydroxy-tetrahydrodipicolinate reductase